MFRFITGLTVIAGFVFVTGLRWELGRVRGASGIWGFLGLFLCLVSLGFRVARSGNWGWLAPPHIWQKWPEAPP